MSILPEEVVEIGGGKAQAVSHSPSMLVYNIKRLMRAKGLNEADLAKKTAIPQPTLHKVLAGRTGDPRISTLQLICKFFNISLDVAMYTPAHEQLDVGATGVKRQTKNIPVISWQQGVDASNFLSLLTADSGSNWRIVSVKSDKVVALVSKISMEPRFAMGTELLIDLNAKPADGDWVMVHYPNTDEATLRQLFLDGPVKRLSSINNEREYDICDEHTRVLGVVIQATRSFYEN